MNTNDLYKRIEKIVTDALKSGQNVEETIEKNVEEITKKFFEEGTKSKEEIEKIIVDGAKKTKEETKDNVNATGAAVKGMLKGAKEGAELSKDAAMDVFNAVLKSSILMGLDLMKIPKLMFDSFKESLKK